MADAISTTRRNLLKSIPACGLAAVVPVAAVATISLTPEERLRKAAAEIRQAMKALGVESYMVMVREEESGIAKMLDFNRDGTLHRLLEIA